MIYIDSNVFILAIANADELGDKCRRFLRTVQDGKEKAATSALTFDEVVWKILQLRDFNDAMLVADDFVKMPNLLLLGVNANVLSKSCELMKLYKMQPRDSIHAACALNNGISTILSEDKDFDKIKELKRKSLSQLKI